MVHRFRHRLGGGGDPRVRWGNTYLYEPIFGKYLCIAICHSPQVHICALCIRPPPPHPTQEENAHCDDGPRRGVGGGGRGLLFSVGSLISEREL